ncbi:hypothetical protein KORDIASMS9_02419 [Kordia sp. SMS9]|uniref:hypothetical protein n=1 Tax=Kordia sp. SMS9 TaxID=2282170 RepID=UPI000E0D11F2|nr:hypothetical protein [Kordia sp. SMS9]AXG70180.1 hypothetical protein KORDIASMS9_02419 [Kordia sp. SMS9]
MKTLQKISFALIILISLSSFASPEYSKKIDTDRNELIDKMSNDNDVSEFCITLLKERMAINLYGDINLVKNSEVLKEFGIIKAKQVKIVRDKYPELLELNLSERQEVFEKALSKSTNYKDQLKCLGMNFLRLAVAQGYVTGMKWKLVKLGICAAGSVFVDASQEIATGGTATPAVTAEVIEEAKFCLAVSRILNGGQLVIVEEALRRILFGCSNDRDYDFDEDADEDGVNDN